MMSRESGEFAEVVTVGDDEEMFQKLGGDLERLESLLVMLESIGENTPVRLKILKQAQEQQASDDPEARTREAAIVEMEKLLSGVERKITAIKARIAELKDESQQGV